MQLPSESSAYTHRVAFGLYLATRLERARLHDLEKSVTQVTEAVKAAGRAWEDADGPLQKALAIRHAVDQDDLDPIAQKARQDLAGRSLSAMREAPYTVIFHSGIEYYTAAPLDEEVKRYNELIDRLEENLPETDPVRVAAVPELKKGIAAFKEAVEKVEAAQSASGRAKTRLDSAEEAWEDLMEKTYGALVSLYGRAKAERFFPKAARGSRKGE